MDSEITRQLVEVKDFNRKFVWEVLTHDCIPTRATRNMMNHFERQCIPSINRAICCGCLLAHVYMRENAPIELSFRGSLCELSLAICILLDAIQLLCGLPCEY